MVKGLDLFREHFRGFVDRYVLIGGTACDLIMNDAGLEFRATKDLDIVLCIESLDRAFAQTLWQFIRAGRYKTQETAMGQKKFYRFQKPANDAYPAMLELFSRVPDALSIDEDSHLTPIPIDEEISSLSAILLDKDYYDWIHSGKRVVTGVPVVGPEHLIPLKAKAWLDLRARKQAEETVDEKSIKKHRNDVFRLFQVIDPEVRAALPAPMARDMRSFLENMAREDVDLKAMKLGSISLASILDGFRTIYGVN
jgi:hypothetical protein